MKNIHIVELYNSQNSEYLEWLESRLDNTQKSIRDTINYILEQRKNWGEIQNCMWSCGWECKEKCKNLI